MSEAQEVARLRARVDQLERELAESRSALESLGRTRSTMQTILDLTSASVFAKDLDGRYLVVNPKGAELVGRSPEEILGRTDEELYGAQVAVRFREHDETVKRTMTPSTVQMPIPTPDGDLVYLSTLVPLLDDEGEIFGVAGIATDVTERARAEALLRRRTQELVTAQQIAQLGSWRWNPDTGDVHLSAELSRMLSGDPDDQWDIERLSAITHPEDLPVALDVLRGARSGAHADVVVRITDPLGSGRTRWLHIRTEPSPDDSAEVIGTVQDVTDREVAERERAELEYRLHQTQRLETVGRLAGGVAHDFNNLLAVIGIQAELARRELAGERDASAPHPADTHLADLQIAVERASELTRQLLVFSRHEQPDVRSIDLGALVDALASLLRRTIGADIELEIEAGPGPCTVRADRSQLEQVLVNLAVNARDAMVGGGHLTISCSNSAGAVVLEVRDTGSGMSPDVADRAFEPFFTTKPPGSGTGLGLTTVRTIVERLGGSIELLTSAGEGTTVSIRLPATTDPPEGTDVGTGTAALDDDSDGGTVQHTILIVEDLDALANLAATVLSRSGYRTLVANNGVLALDIVEREPAIDLLLTDVVMPEMSGGELAERLRGVLPGLPVVFMSGYSAGMLEGRLPPGERVTMLAKPFSAADLRAAVERALSSDSI